MIVIRKIGRRGNGVGVGLTVKLHPLLIVNISDHHTSVKSQTHHSAFGAALADGSSGAAPSPAPPRVFGCVIGVQRGRTVEIFNSFELVYDPVTHSLDRSFLEKKQELCNRTPSPLSLSHWCGASRVCPTGCCGSLFCKKAGARVSPT
ncbi:hypothetical protein BHE74_00055071, partial [Ensete ventricosum]